MSGNLIGINKCIKSNRGSALVEFALVLPVLLLLFGAIIDFGYMLHQYLVLDEVARAAARATQINRDDTTARRIALAGRTENWGGIRIDFDNPTADGVLRPPSTSVTIRVSCDRIMLHGLIDFLLPENLNRITTTVVAITE